MDILVLHHIDYETDPDFPQEKSIDIAIKKESIAAFKEMVARACNVWPDAPAEIKEFHDILLHGKPLQDYYSQNKVVRIEDLPEADRFRLNNAPAKAGIGKQKKVEGE